MSVQADLHPVLVVGFGLQATVADGAGVGEGWFNGGRLRAVAQASPYRGRLPMPSGWARRVWVIQAVVCFLLLASMAWSWPTGSRMFDKELIVLNKLAVLVDYCLKSQ